MINAKILVIGALFAVGCSKNVEHIKANAEKTFKTAGFEIITYEGYQRGFMGGNVWYLIKQPNKDTIYEAALVKWGDEIHIYNFKAINAIGTTRK